MQKFARLSSAVAGKREVLEIIMAANMAAIERSFHPAIVEHVVAAPSNVGEGYLFDGDGWEAPSPVDVPEPGATYRTRLTRPEFKLQFTSAERIAIRAARDYTGEDSNAAMTKAILDDFFDIVEDTALTFVDLELPATIEGVGFLATAGLLTEERVGEILAGLPEQV